MATRGIIRIRYKHISFSLYVFFDGYFTVLGIQIIRFLIRITNNDYEYKKFINNILNSKFITWENEADGASYTHDTLYRLIYTPLTIEDCSDKHTLCEYIIDFDKQTFNYSDFENKTSNTVDFKHLREESTDNLFNVIHNGKQICLSSNKLLHRCVFLYEFINQNMDAKNKMKKYTKNKNKLKYYNNGKSIDNILSFKQ